MQDGPRQFRGLHELPTPQAVIPVYELRVFLSSNWLFFHFDIRSKFNCRN